MIEEDSTALVLFEQGLLDLVKLPPLEIRRYQARPEYLREPLLRGYYYGFNTRTPPFDDPRVRRAFALALDPTQFPPLLQGGELPWSSWIPPGMPHANEALGLRFDPERARALLREAQVDPAALAPVASSTQRPTTSSRREGAALWREPSAFGRSREPRV